MARIGIVVPYQELYCEAKLIAAENGDIEVKLGLLSDGVDVAKELIRNGIEVLISRGGTSNYLKKEFKSIPVIDIEISSFDIAEAILSAKKYNSDIALVVFKNMLYEKRDLSVLFDCNIRVYDIEEETQVEAAVMQASKDGYRIILGGRLPNKIAAQLGISSIMIASGRDSIYRAVMQARNILRTKDEAAKELKLIKDVIENTSIGIIAANSAEIIKIANIRALKMLNKKREQVIGSKVDSIFPPQVTGEDGNFVIDGNGNKLIVDKKSRYIESIDIASIITIEESSYINEKERNIRSSYLKKGYKAKYNFSDIKGKTKTIRDVLEIAKRYSEVNSTTLIEGETGTGKEMLAQSIHNYSSRKNGPFVAINCAALTESLLESELFGYVGGAFTGALKSGKAGLFEMADGGTIFLDEISEVSPTTQAKLLRVLQEKEVRRLGDDRIISIDVRVITATNKSLQKLVDELKFRSDLYYRISVLKLKIPPLRERREDIRVLFEEFLKYYSVSLEREPPIIDDSCYDLILKYRWPGNIRELRNFAERLVTAFDRKNVLPEMLYKILDIEEKPSVEQLDIKNIMKVLEQNGQNKAKTAKDLGISRTTLWKMLKENKIIV